MPASQQGEKHLRHAIHAPDVEEDEAHLQPGNHDIVRGLGVAKKTFLLLSVQHILLQTNLVSAPR